MPKPPALREVLAREEGATIIEYCLGLMLIVFVTISAMRLLGSSFSAFFASAASSI